MLGNVFLMLADWGLRRPAGTDKEANTHKQQRSIHTVKQLLDSACKTPDRGNPTLIRMYCRNVNTFEHLEVLP